MLFYRAALPLSRSTLTYVAGVLRRHRKKIGSCWRILNPGRQALLVLVHLRKGETFAGLAAGFGVGTTTAWRYVQETGADTSPAMQAESGCPHPGLVTPLHRAMVPKPASPWRPRPADAVCNAQSAMHPDPADKPRTNDQEGLTASGDQAPDDLDFLVAGGGI